MRLASYVDAMLAAERRAGEQAERHQRSMWQMAGVFVLLVLAEVQRRLAELNHENARIKENQAAHVTNERFDGYVRGQEQEARAVAKALNLAEGGDQQLQRRRGVVTQWQLWAAGVVLAFVVLLANGKLP